MMLSLYDLTGKSVVVTGGSRGIGRAICHVLAELGADIVVAGRNITTIEETAEGVRERGKKALAIQTDVCDKAQVERLFAGAIETFGKLDIFVNSAGGVTAPQMVPFLEMEYTTWQQVVDVNLNAAFTCCQMAAKEMVKQNQGNIINISSISGIQPYPFCVAYGASKAAVNSLTQSMATILGPYNIRVNAIVPGAIMAGVGLDMAKDNPDLIEQRKKAIPLGRIGTPEDVAWAVAYLASDASSYVTGHLLTIDGAIPKSPSLAARK